MRRYLTFFVSQREYGVALERVIEITESTPITHVPSLPAAVSGVVNLRGDVVPVLDLGIRFGLPEQSTTRHTCFVFIDVGSGDDRIRMALRVDGVESIVDLADGEMAAVPPFGVNIPLEFLAGVGMTGSKLVLLLDLDRVLSLDEIGSVATTLHEAQ